MSGRYSQHAHQRDRQALFAVQPQRLNGSSTPNTNSSTAPTPYRSATPNSKGQFSTQVYDDLENQNDEQLDGLFSKVKLLKQVTNNIGEHINEDNRFLSGMEETFTGAGTKLKATHQRMLRAAEKAGITWRVWLIIFVLIGLVFFYRWISR